MKKVFDLIKELKLICSTLRKCNILSCDMFKELRNRFDDIENELCKYEYCESPKGLSFSSMEKYVNDHINLADTETLVGELQRRGIDVKK